MCCNLFPNAACVLSERFGDGDASGLDLDEVDLHSTTYNKLCNLLLLQDVSVKNCNI